jgi:hypothetical protein
VLGLVLLSIAAPGRASAADWGEPQLVGGPVVGTPALASDASGRVYAAWSSGGGIVVSTQQGAGWGPAVAVSAAGANAEDPAIAASPNGQLLVAWIEDGEVYAVVGASPVATNVSMSPGYDSSDVVAGYSPGLGFVLAWREETATPLNRADPAGGRTSQLVEANLAGSIWLGPTVRVASTDAGQCPASVERVFPIASAGASLVVPFVRDPNIGCGYHDPSLAQALVHDGGRDWSISDTGLYGGVSSVAAGVVRNRVVAAAALPIDRGGGLRQSNVALASQEYAPGAWTGGVALPSAVAGEATAVAAATSPTGVRVVSQLSGGLSVTSTSDGVSWSTPTQFAVRPTAVAATSTRGGGALVAYVSDGSLYSVATDRPVPAGDPPNAASPPTISGSPAQGTTLVASPGGWTGSTGGFSYQWRQCNPAGAQCQDIPDASAPTYTVTAGDIASTLRVIVTATSTGGSTPTSSAQTSVVTASAPSKGRSTAAYSIDSQVSYTLPDGFLGISRGLYNIEDVGNPSYMALVNGLDPGFWRMAFWVNDLGTPSAPSWGMSTYQSFAAQTFAAHRPQYLLGLASAPAARPSTLSPMGASNYTGSGSTDPASVPMSPANNGAWIDWWTKTANGGSGYTLAGYEPYNEPATAGQPCTTSNSMPDTYWYAGLPPDGYTDTSGTCIWPDPTGTAADWADVHHRQYQAAVKASQPSLMVCGGAAATSSGINGDGDVQQFIDGTSMTGWPWPSNNVPYMDCFSWHAYGQFGGTANASNQGTLNQIFYPTYTAGTYQSGYQAAGTRYRADLDAKAGQNVATAMTEWEPVTTMTNAALSPGALGDVAIAIVSANNQNAWKLRRFVLMDVNSDDHTAWDGTGSPSVQGDGIILRKWGTANDLLYQGSVRYWTLRNMLIPFLRSYVAAVRVTPTTNPGPTPSAGLSNSVPGIQLYAGKDAAGNLGILVENINLTTSTDVTFSLGQTPAGPISLTRLPIDQPVNTPLPTTSVTVGSSSFTQTIGAGEADMLEIPLAAQTSKPASPTNLTLTQQGRRVALSWTASSTPGVTYRVYRQPSGTSPYASGVTGTTYSDANVVSGTSYTYWVTAFNGVSESDPSNQATLTVR